MSLEPVIQSELVKKRKTLNINVYIWSQEKMALMKLFVEQELRHRHREQACGPRRGRKKGLVDILGEGKGGMI